MVEVYQSKIDTEYGAADILMKGISTCANVN